MRDDVSSMPGDSMHIAAYDGEPVSRIPGAVIERRDAPLLSHLRRLHEKR